VADGWAFEIDKERDVGRFRWVVGGGVRWAVMKLSWGGRWSGGMGRWVTVGAESGLLGCQPFSHTSVAGEDLPSPCDGDISRGIG
jgi:hypothetical protein